MTNLDSILKSRDISLPTNVCLVKALVFLVVMYGCESWTIKKAEGPRINAFELWCWRRLLRVPWIVRRSKRVHPKGNQSWIFIGRTDAEAETLILWPPDRKSWLIWKDPDPGKDWRGEEKGTTEDEIVGCHHWWTWVSVNSGSWWWTGRPGMLQVHGITNSWTQMSDWTELMIIYSYGIWWQAFIFRIILCNL